MQVQKDEDIVEKKPAAKRGRPISHARRAELLDLVASMFAKEGYHGTSMRDLADRAGINAASLYHYFSSKEDALLEVCLAGAQATSVRIEKAIGSPASLEERFRRIIEEHIADLEAHSDYRHVYFEQRSNLKPEQFRQVEAETRRVRLLLEKMFGEAIAAGELHPDLDSRKASFTFAGLLRALTQYYVAGPIRDYPDLARGMSETILRGLRR